MSRQMMDYDEELMKVWALVNELSEQLANNRALVQQLKSRTENVKGQAVHAGAGFPLRRFNLDISDEEFQSELEAFASHLVLENQTLQHENKQLNGLLKEYEQTLETVMGKFRGVAHASQQHDLALHSYYSQLLQSLQTAHSAAQLHDDTSLSLLLTRLSTLLRSALRSLNGEEGTFDPSALSGLLSPPDEAVRSPSPLSPSVNPPRGRRKHFPGFVPGTSGGYIGTEGQSDWAMEREMEIQRLEEENKALREMLGIAEEVASEDPEPEHDEAEKSPVIGSQRRPSTYTVEELEADAQKEADEREHGAIDTIEEEPSAPLPDSVLGFRAEADEPPPENVFDETDGEAVP
ncbi:hypothetical protein VHUM_01079 [Vanrija humicola]|uniref:Uncharacterized protein n=1 Tax=Vanrija humicola TaxID=5417 RepID=A0A7D8Z6F8_VANHU|nr:hypothetical protein VHUM_01079 [Vanrija humicola]